MQRDNVKRCIYVRTFHLEADELYLWEVGNLCLLRLQSCMHACNYVYQLPVSHSDMHTHHYTQNVNILTCTRFIVLNSAALLHIPDQMALLSLPVCHRWPCSEALGWASVKDSALLSFRSTLSPSDAEHMRQATLAHCHLGASTNTTTVYSPGQLVRSLHAE